MITGHKDEEKPGITIIPLFDFYKTANKISIIRNSRFSFPVLFKMSGTKKKMKTSGI